MEIELVGRIRFNIKLRKRNSSSCTRCLKVMILKIIRFIAFVPAFASVLAFLVALSPITLLNSLFRSLGVAEAQLPANVITPLVMRLALYLGGVRIQVEGKTGHSSVIYMYNHTSNLDPLIVGSIVDAKFCYKKELGKVPLLGWCLYLYNHISIDRRNREKAIESLDRAVDKVVKKHQNFGIAPEGTRSLTGELQEFKKGGFHCAVKSQASIVPIVIHGAFSLLPPRKVLFSGALLRVTLLPPVPVTDTTDTNKLSDAVRALYISELARRPAKKLKEVSQLVLSLPAIGVIFFTLLCFL